MNSMKVTKINIRLFYVHDKQSDFIYFLEIYYFLNEGKAWFLKEFTFLMSPYRF